MLHNLVQQAQDEVMELNINQQIVVIYKLGLQALLQN